MFESSHIPLLTWIHCIFLLTRPKKKMTVRELAEHLTVAYPTAWRMKKKIEDRLDMRNARQWKNVTFEKVLSRCSE